MADHSTLGKSTFRSSHIKVPLGLIMDVQQLFKNLKKEAECPLCIETVKNPKTLLCLHSFCLECLDKLVGFARRQLQTTIKCPVCQTSFHIPEGGSFINLPASFHLNRLVDLLALKDGSEQAQKCDSCDEKNSATCYCFVCQNFLCEACFEAHQRLKATRGHRNVLIEKLQSKDVEELIHRPVMCSQQYHENQPLEFYCEECKVPICHKCTVVSHNRHTMTDTQKAAQTQKMQIAEAVEKVKAEIAMLDSKIEKQTGFMNEHKSEILSAEKKITDAVEELIRNLREHEREMKTKFRGIYEAQQKHHATRLEEFEIHATQLKSCVERGESILQRNISAEILQTNQAILGRCDELLNTIKPECFNSPHVYYVLENKEKILDRIVVSNTDASTSFAEGQSLQEGKVKEKMETNFTIVARDSDRLQCYEEHDQVKVDILSPAGSHLKTEIKDTKDGKYTVTYTPQCAGQHTVEIQVNGQPLTGSPWAVQVVPHQYEFLFQFGSAGKGQGEFNNPSDVAVSEKTGTIAVADKQNKRIQMFRSDGNFLRQIKLQGVSLSIAFTDSGNLITCFSGADAKFCISLFGEEGEFMRHIKNEHLLTPFRLSLASDGRIITCDWSDDKIKVLSADGKDLLQSFAAPDSYSRPFCAICHQNRFFVSYLIGNKCVKVFNSSGVYLYDIGCEGSGDGQLSYHTGLVIDKFNRLIVCDTSNGRLHVFTLDGKFISKIKGQYFDESGPWSAAVSATGHLFVADGKKNCIYVFQ